MKKLLIILMVCFVFVGCDRGSYKDDKQKEITSGIQVTVVNGCQYVLYINGILAEASSTMVHAGNCNNPIHQSKWIFTIDSVTGEINLPYIQK